MSEAYKQKEYELRSAIDNISSIPYVFENYVEETEHFIDRLLDDTKEINTLRNKLQQKENIIKKISEFAKLRKEMYEKQENVVGQEVIISLLNILDKGE